MTLELLNYINTALYIVTAIGGVYAFVRAKKSETIRIQNDTIQAMQQQIEVIKAKLDDMEKENSRLKQIIETIQFALRAKGIHITIDGDMVEISEQKKRSSISTRKRSTKIAGTSAK